MAKRTQLDRRYTELAGHAIGDYVLDEFVGEGKLGVVYRGTEKAIPDRAVAIKIHPGAPPGWENEIKKVARLQGVEGIVPLHRVETALLLSEPILYTVWDYIPGPNLRMFLQSADNCSASFFIAVVKTILLVLNACDHRGVPRHGDLHAGNILVGPDDPAVLDDRLMPRKRVYVSDFGYGTTGGGKAPKDDYLGLAQIADEMLAKFDRERASAVDRQVLDGVRNLLQKVLRERHLAERVRPRDILEGLQGIDLRARAGGVAAREGGLSQSRSGSFKIGSYQISEMLGENWEWWKALFEPNVPVRSRVMEPDIPTVLTGPRGCGKTMIFKRLSERLVVECGAVEGADLTSVGFYVNANDIAAAFPHFPSQPTSADSDRLICYTNLCYLADILGVQSSQSARTSELVSPRLLGAVEQLLHGDKRRVPLLVGEAEIERLRADLEGVKATFPRTEEAPLFPGFLVMRRIPWLAEFLATISPSSSWLRGKRFVLFLDDYTTPRVSVSMQRSLNRALFHRQGSVVWKIATESATTFVPQDDSGKTLQDGDDYLLIDMAEESLFMTEIERAEFLNGVFRRRLDLELRVPSDVRDLSGLLGTSSIGKTEFARRLRSARQDSAPAGRRRGATRARVLYSGADVFSGLWSGDTRLMIQLMQDLVDEAKAATAPARSTIDLPMGAELQDRVLRNRGGQWLESHTRDQPTDATGVEKAVAGIRKGDKSYRLAGGTYGSHLKAVVEAFVRSARALLLGPMYSIDNRDVPRMAFRIEIVDEFRVEGLAIHVYQDLIRYGLFLRDARGKSVRGAMVPRLYLRRFVLPYCALALSKRDSVPVTCAEFCKLLLRPDDWKPARRSRGRQARAIDQLSMLGDDTVLVDPIYDDTSDDKAAERGL